MRIAILNWRDSAHPRSGGAEELVERQALELANRGHSVTIFTSGFRGSKSYESRGAFDIRRLGDDYSVYLAVARVVRRLTTRGEVDVVLEHINGLPWYSPVWSKAPVAAYVYHVVGPVFFQRLPPPISAIGFFAERTMAMVYQSTPIGCLGPSSLNEFEGIGLPHSGLFPIPPGAETFDIRSHFPKSSEPQILMVGPIKRYKHHDTAIRALGVLVKTIPSARLIIIGKDHDGLESSLATLASKLGIAPNVEIRGYVSTEEKFNLMGESWALLYCSDREGWGLGVTEAAACETPSIVSPANGLLDALRIGSAGVSYQGGWRELGRVLTELCRRPESLFEMGRLARRKCTALSWREHGQAIESLLEQARSGHRRRDRRIASS